MDDKWERSIPLYNIGLYEVLKIFREYIENITIINVKQISIGCRNSNYIIDTNCGKYFLRICPDNTNEKEAYKILDNKVKRPELLYETSVNKYPCYIYQYIDGISLQNHGLSNNIIKQAAENLAFIHNSKTYKRLPAEYPPFRTWYNLFLGHNAQDRLGSDVANIIKDIINKSSDLLDIIDSGYCLTHNDYRPSNMLVDDKDNLYIVDWEYARSGHRYGDIGQFFRYTDYFTENHKNLFYKTYNINSKHKLHEDWFLLSRLRDLANLLQMINVDKDLPMKFKDLKNIITEILMYVSS